MLENGVERMKLYGILKDIMSFGRKYISFLDVTICFMRAKVMLYECQNHAFFEEIGGF